jgi:hypothetical protein
MANQFSQLFTPVVLPAAAASLWPMPTTNSNTILRNGRVRLTNTTGGSVSVTLYADVAATASSAANACLSAFSIAGNSFADVDLPVLKAGDTLRGFASAAASITMHHIDGFLVTP